VIAVSHLTRRFGDRIAVDDVSLEVRAGEIVALLGPNGAGKTTTMRMMAGLIAPSSGTVTVGSVELTPRTANRLRSAIGVLPEAPGLWDRLTVLENLRVYAGIYGVGGGDGVLRSALERFDVADRISTRAAELSKGMRQKVALARTLLHDPKILLLDEPTSGLDPEITRSVRMLLEERRAQGCAVLVSTHNLDEAERIADRVAVMHTRLVAVDTPAALRRRLTSGRTIVRLRGSASAFLGAAQAFDKAATSYGDALALTIDEPESSTPALVRALVAAGADIVEVRTEVVALEDVYLRLMATASGRG
jgi:ABC-2 type transport system ATP-binding protein